MVMSMCTREPAVITMIDGGFCEAQSDLGAIAHYVEVKASGELIVAIPEGKKLDQVLLVQHKVSKAESACSLQISLAADSNLAVMQEVHTESLEASLKQVSQIELSHAAQLDYHVSYHGRGRTECELTAKLHGDGSHCRIHGVLLGQERSQCHNHWLMQHLGKQTHSDMHFRAVMNDSAQGSWVGHAHVTEGALGSDVTQMSRQILLSPSAAMQARPELTIDCDDVACRHGATVGQLDEDALFYLRSRGLAKQEAQQLLLWSFLQQALTMWPESSWAHLRKDVIKEVVYGR